MERDCKYTKGYQAIDESIGNLNKGVWGQFCLKELV